MMGPKLKEGLGIKIGSVGTQALPNDDHFPFMILGKAKIDTFAALKGKFVNDMRNPSPCRISILMPTALGLSEKTAEIRTAIERAVLRYSARVDAVWIARICSL